ncbi:hypothetical protein [Flagellimonas beolgyonensis]|uniref:hypothetical protein n=1 Tax=Flagellimonas beolgyonensis TaxID=864064 RepID=UPI000F8C6408|nr:hypothetical protein [Allomuricauda beolgyonensis]
MSPKQNLELLVDFFQNHSFTVTDTLNELILVAPEGAVRELLGKSNGNHDFDLMFASTGEGDSFRLAGSRNIFGIDIFDSRSNFSKAYKSLDSSKNYLIFDNQSKQFISWVEGNVYKSNDRSSDEFFFSNIFNFKEFEKKWIEIGKEANLSDEDFSFIDYYNIQRETFLLSTISNKIQVKQPTFFPETDEDLSNRLDLFHSCFNIDSKKQFPKFIKKNLIESISEYGSEERLIQSFLKFDKIYEKADLDFQVYLNDISIDKLRDEYEDFKRESLMPFSEITSSLTIKILSVPIAFSAILFSLSRISNPVLQIGVIFSLLLSSIILNFSLKNHFSDLIAIYRLFGKKVKKIGEHNFFVKNPREKSEIREVITHIVEKVRYSQRFIWSYFIISSLLFLFVCVFFLWPIIKTIDFTSDFDKELFDAQYVIVLVLALLFLVVTCVQGIVLKKDATTLKVIGKDYSLEKF